MPRKPKGPLTRPCPRCHAPTGKPCTAPSGRLADVPHAARRNPTRPHRPDKANDGGHPTLLTPDLTEQITAALKLGVPITTAAQAAGIAPGTLFRWIAQADIDDPRYAPHREFREAVARARAEGQIRHVALLNKAAQGGYKRKELTRTFADGTTETEVTYADVEWRASAFVLERSYARDFSKRETLEVSQSDGVEVVPGVGAGDAASGAGLDAAGLDRLIANMGLFRARKEIEAGPAGGADEGIEDAEIVEG